ncbi:MAG: hypothetical protein IJP35_07905 [Clostridia bacterium]|nr:hypothetical protein [Clostridia bacterium]
MYGYSDNTITYWMLEAVLTGVMAVLLALGIWRKWRWCALVYPVGQLFLRAAVLIWQPTEFGYESVMEQTALMLGLCLFSALLLRYPWMGWVIALGGSWMLFMIVPSGFPDLGIYFSYGYELIYLALQVIFSALLHVALMVYGVLFALGRIGQPKTVKMVDSDQ